MSNPPAKKLEAHIFVCTNERPPDHPRGCCQEKNSETLVKTFKSEIGKTNRAGKVRSQRSGCLDVCEYGPAVVVYPEGIWYGPVQESDVAEIVQSHILGGRPVERLKIPGK